MARRFPKDKSNKELRGIVCDETDPRRLRAAFYLAVRREPYSPEESFGFYQMAARNGHVPSMVSAGVCLRTGFGVKADSEAGIEWYTRAAELGSVAALNNLGIIAKQNNQGKDAIAYFKKIVETPAPIASEVHVFTRFRRVAATEIARIYSGSCDENVLDDQLSREWTVLARMI